MTLTMYALFILLGISAVIIVVIVIYAVIEIKAQWRAEKIGGKLEAPSKESLDVKSKE